MLAGRFTRKQRCVHELQLVNTTIFTDERNRPVKGHKVFFCPKCGFVRRVRL